MNKIRVYSSTTEYTDIIPTSNEDYYNMQVYPGQRVIFYHLSGRSWSHSYNNGSSDSAWSDYTSDAISFTVPSNATGNGVLKTQHWDFGYGGANGTDYFYTNSWLAFDTDNNFNNGKVTSGWCTSISSFYT